MSISKAPSYYEYSGLVEEVLTENDFRVETDEDRQFIMTSVMALLEEFSNTHNIYDVDYVNSQSFENDIERLKNDLKELLTVLFEDYKNTLMDEEENKWLLPEGIVVIDSDIDNVILPSVDSAINQLYDDSVVKAVYFISAGLEEEFNIVVNIKRAVSRFKNIVNFNADTVSQEVDRSYLNFVYGEDALFQWVCSGRNTCAWCYMLEGLGPKPLEFFPYDHPNGNCVLEPVNPTDYSDLYLLVKMD